MLLEGKVATITGASRGIGAATAEASVAAGAAVTVAARSVRNSMRWPPNFRHMAVKLSPCRPMSENADSIENLVKRTLRKFGRLNVAFNNAGGGGQGPIPFADLPVEAFDSAIAVSLRGVFLSMKYEIPAILATGGGAIVNMSSTAGLADSPVTLPPSTELSV